MENKTIYEQMPKFMRLAIQEGIKKATDEEFEEAKKRIDKRKSEIIAGIILYIEKKIDIQQMKENLIITIKQDD